MSSEIKRPAEIRSLHEAELRVEPSGGVIEGYASVFDKEANGEIVRKGAFAKALQGSDIRCLFDHDPARVLGRTKAGTLVLHEDDHGLYFRCTPPRVQWVDDLRESIKRGDITGASFAFRSAKARNTMIEGRAVVELLEVPLHEVSVVTFPWYPDTHVVARHQGPVSGPPLSILRARLDFLERLARLND